VWEEVKIWQIILSESPKKITLSFNIELKLSPVIVKTVPPNLEPIIGEIE